MSTSFEEDSTSSNNAKEITENKKDPKYYTDKLPKSEEEFKNSDELIKLVLLFPNYYLWHNLFYHKPYIKNHAYDWQSNLYYCPDPQILSQNNPYTYKYKNPHMSNHMGAS